MVSDEQEAAVTEYAVLCASGEIHHDTLGVSLPMARLLARDADEARWRCTADGPHRVMQRTVTPWEASDGV